MKFLQETRREISLGDEFSKLHETLDKQIYNKSRGICTQKHE